MTMLREIKKNIIEIYPICIESIDKIIDSVYDRCYQSDAQVHWYNSDDERNGIFQIYLSILVNEKTKIYLSHNFIASDDFLDQYRSKIMSIKNKDTIKPILHWLNNLDVDLRFDFFLKFYSQFESLIRQIYRRFDLKKEPFQSVFKKLDILDENFILKINTIRNSIHNGGRFYPLPRQKQEVEYYIGDSKYTLQSGDPIQMGWGETIDIISEIIDFTFKIVDTNEILFDNKKW